MRKSAIVIAVIALTVGLGLFMVGMKDLSWELSRLNTSEMVTNSYEITEKFSDITLVADTADISFVPSEDGSCRVVCRENKKELHHTFVDSGTLFIQLETNRAWYEHIGIHFESPKITVYLPEGQHGDLWIKSSTGNVELAKDFSFENAYASLSTGHIRWSACVAGELNLKTSTGAIYTEGITAQRISVTVSTGKAELADITCEKLLSKGSTGDVRLKNVLASELFSVERSTGDVTFEGCDGGQITVKTDTGDVRGTLLTDKVFIVHSDTGRVDVPEALTGGRCEITTDTGDIRITITD